MTDPRWLSPAEARAWRGLQEARAALDAAVEQQLVEHGLSGADYAVLVALSEADGPAVRARDVAGLLGWDRSRLSHQLRRMEARGLLGRTDCPEDARGTMVALTPQGREAVEAAAPGHVATVRRVFVDLLSPEETAVLGDVFARVREAACTGAPPCDGAVGGAR